MPSSVSWLQKFAGAYAAAFSWIVQYRLFWEAKLDALAKKLEKPEA